MLRSPKFPSATCRALCSLSRAAWLSAAALGQELTPHPENWRPIVYRDLQIPGPGDRIYVDLWADVIQSNNRRYLAAGDRRYAIGNAPVREAHVVVRGGDKAALLSILDTATHCVTVAEDPGGEVFVKMCPMRLALWNGAQTTHKRGEGLLPRAKRKGAKFHVGSVICGVLRLLRRRHEIDPSWRHARASRRRAVFAKRAALPQVRLPL